jgi:hypothetical protein
MKRGRLRTAFVVLVLACASDKLRADGFQPYVHRGAEIALTVTVWAYDPERPGMQEKLNFPITLKPGETIMKPSEFIPAKAYARAAQAMKKKKMVLPELLDLRRTAVVRAPRDGGHIYARSDRVLSWPKGYQLRGGEVIMIFPLSD